MSEAVSLEIQRLAMEVSRLVESLSTWLSTEEMCARYTCTPQTLRNMERRGPQGHGSIWWNYTRLKPRSLR